LLFSEVISQTVSTPKNFHASIPHLSGIFSCLPSAHPAAPLPRIIAVIATQFEKLLGATTTNSRDDQASPAIRAKPGKSIPQDSKLFFDQINEKFFVAMFFSGINRLSDSHPSAV